MPPSHLQPQHTLASFPSGRFGKLPSPVRLADDRSLSLDDRDVQQDFPVTSGSVYEGH